MLPTERDNTALKSVIAKLTEDMTRMQTEATTRIQNM